MKADVELILTHDGERWIARNDWCVAAGRTLGELDANVAHALRDNGAFGASRVAVFMGFDFDTIPTWMRQYGSHYFNRRVTLNLGDAGSEEPTGGCAERGAENQ